MPERGQARLPNPQAALSEMVDWVLRGFQE
jgi:hypothetical protein